MANMPGRFKVIDIERILRAAKNADVSVRIAIKGETIAVENLPDAVKETIEPKPEIIL